MERTVNKPDLEEEGRVALRRGWGGGGAALVCTRQLLATLE